MLLVKRTMYDGMATQAHLPSIAPSSGVVGHWCMLNVFGDLWPVKRLLTETIFSTRMQLRRFTNLGGIVGRELS